MKKRLVSLLLVLACSPSRSCRARLRTLRTAAWRAAPVPGTALTHITNYRPNDEDTHFYGVYCTGCGIGGGVVLEGSHTFSGNTCTLRLPKAAVAAVGTTDYCYHDWTYREWDGCYWYEYCEDCGDLVDCGVSHGVPSTTTGSITTAASTAATPTAPTAARANMSTGGTARARNKQYTSTQHRVVDYCSTCDSNVGSATYESHSFQLWQLAELQRHSAPQD